MTELQRLVTEFAWGDIWSRPQLSPATRSLITIALLTASNRPHELVGHLRGAVNNGCSESDIREVILHCVAYCGFPAAMDATRIFDALIVEERLFAQ